MYQPLNTAAISRVWRSHQDAREAYDRMSSWYDFLASSEQKFTRQALDLLAVQPEECVLDLGCGTGSSLVSIYKSTGQKAKIIGCDLSQGMLAKARVKLSLATDVCNVKLIRGDLTNLPIQFDSIDAILMSFSLELFDTPEIPLVLAECRRALKHGGRMAVVSLAKTAKPGWMERGYEWLHAHFEKFADCRPILAAELIQDAGFEITQEQREVMWGLPVDIHIAVR